MIDSGKIGEGDETYHPHIIESAYSGKYIQATTYEGQTALHIASNLNLHGSIQPLLNTGADINAVDMYGNSSLHNAIMFRSVDVAKKLIVLGADLFAVNHKSLKPFDLCEEDNLCTPLYARLLEKNKIDYNLNLNVYLKRKKTQIVKGEVIVSPNELW
jgi:ankyrin repeat protein